MVIAGLIVVLLMVLALPFAVKKIEENLEAFLFLMGICACIISSKLNGPLVLKAIEEPWKIALAVLVAGALFFILKDQFSKFMENVFKKIPVPVVIFTVIVVLGFLSSVITAIIASIVLVEVIYQLPLERKHKINVCILACFSIGLGAAMTPIGEPLATIAISKLDKDFFYLFNLLGKYIIPSVIVFGLLGAIYTTVIGKNASLSEAEATGQASVEDFDDVEEECWKGIITRALKVYLFVMALVFLGEGFEPIIEKYIISLSPQLLYWVNMVSAVLDNATLTAAEISPMMDSVHVEAILMGLLISGGMLIPGNIPNIISASKLRITSTEWAKLGVPLGLIVMAVFYFILFVIIGIGG